MNEAAAVSQGVMLFITLFLMLVGLIFTIVPPLPGTVIIWGASIVYGLVLGWEQLGWLTFGLLTFLMLVGIVMDFLAGHFGARLGGASFLAILVGAVMGLALGILASFIGTPVLGCLAGVAGMFLGVLLIEWGRNRDWKTALKATTGYAAGSVVGMMVKITSGLLMLGVFLVRIYGGG